MQMAAIRTTWAGDLRDLFQIKEWAERFPHLAADDAAAWADAEIDRIGKAIEELPEGHAIARPDVDKFQAAMEAIYD